MAPAPSTALRPSFHLRSARDDQCGVYFPEDAVSGTVDNVMGIKFTLYKLLS